MAKYKLISGHHRVGAVKTDDTGMATGSGKAFIGAGDVIESETDLTKAFPGKFELVKATKPAVEKAPVEDQTGTQETK